ncbi:MAG: hypothetical protein F4138_02560 [Acidimicrobiia bacterium]|nr:hypothetical protein [Acidimicrobiia bacterium]
MNIKRCFLALFVSLALLGSSFSASATELPSRDDIDIRNALIVAQENLLNAYRCNFDIDVHIVLGGCLDGEPALGPLTTRSFSGTPMWEMLTERDNLILFQEELLNAYRCLFQVDLAVVVGGCAGVAPILAPTSEPEPEGTWTWPEVREWRSGTSPSGRVFAETATIWGGGNSGKTTDYLWVSCETTGPGGPEVGVTDSNGWERWDNSSMLEKRILWLPEGITAWWEWDWDELVSKFDDLLPFPWGAFWRSDRSVDFYPFDGRTVTAFVRWANNLSRGGWLMMLADNDEGEVLWMFNLSDAYEHIKWVAERCRFTWENDMVQMPDLPFHR